jgi:hypothetical protein
MKYLILLLILACTACNSSQNHDLHDDQDSHNYDIKTDDFVEINDNGNDMDLDSKDDIEIEDEDADPDEIPEADISDDAEEWPDYDYPAGTEGDPDCPSLLNAGFPYIDKDGKKHFCRKCDLPAPENDPQCIRNLWEFSDRETFTKAR